MQAFFFLGVKQMHAEEECVAFVWDGSAYIKSI